MKKNTLKWGILGTARIAQNKIIPAIKSSRRNELYAVASRSLTKAEEFARLNVIPKVYGSYEELLRDETVQAVYIPLPNSLHKSWTIAAINAGKHVLCEKPIGLNQAEAREMAALAEEKGVILMEGFAYRYHPRYEKLFEMVSKGAIGSPRYIHSTFTFNITNPNDIRLVPELGGGALMDVGCYCIDISRQLTEREPVSVQAQFYEGNTGVDLQVAATLDFGDNIYAQFEAAFNTTKQQSIKIAGNEGSLIIQNPFLSGGKRTRAVLSSEEEEKTMHFWGKNEYKHMFDHFQRLVAGKAEPRYPLSHSIADMRIIDAIKQSMQDGGRLIRLEDVPEVVIEKVVEMAEVAEEVKAQIVEPSPELTEPVFKPGDDLGKQESN